MIQVHDLYKAKNFSVWEFVPKSVYDKFGEQSRHFINDKLIIVAQELRNDLGKPLYINTWGSGGDLHYRGYRPPFSRIGALLSQHKFGQAMDVSSNVPHYNIYDCIMDRQKKYYELGVRRIENPEATRGNHLGWIHLDTLNVGAEKIHTFNP